MRGTSSQICQSLSSEISRLIKLGLFINLTPLVPLSLGRRGGRILREATPLFNSLLIPTMLKERGEGLKRGAKPLSLPHSPFPYQGKGARGIGC